MMNVKPFAKTLNKKPVMVFGLGVSGMATVKALIKAGVKVIAWDDNPEKRQEAESAGAFIGEDFSDCAALVLAPGIPYTYNPHPIVTGVQEAGIEILGDLEILHRCDHGRLTIGITGTNGKSTTTSLLGHVFKACKVKTAVGGNIGTPALEMKLPPKKGVLVLEVSSYQMDLCRTYTPDISILLNVTPDHIDRHGSIEEYAGAKARIFNDEGTAIISIDDAYCQAIYEAVLDKGERQVIPLSVLQTVPGGVYANDNNLIDNMNDKAEKIGDLSHLGALPGAHNHQNVIAAYAAARAAGLAPQAIFEAMKSYPGLPHRQYLTRVINGVAYVNDSKATNAEATAKALGCYKNIYWILGGRSKEGGLDGLESYMDHIKQAFLIGEAQEEFGAWLEKRGVSHHYCQTLDVAVLDAHHAAQSARGEPGGTGTVLLSPACASWDQFSSFEARGDAFTHQVAALDEEMAA